jgi:hypothetical protein
MNKEIAYEKKLKMIENNTYVALQKFINADNQDFFNQLSTLATQEYLKQSPVFGPKECKQVHKDALRYMLRMKLI